RLAAARCEVGGNRDGGRRVDRKDRAFELIRPVNRRTEVRRAGHEDALAVEDPAGVGEGDPWWGRHDAGAQEVCDLAHSTRAGDTGRDDLSVNHTCNTVSLVARLERRRR